ERCVIELVDVLGVDVMVLDGEKSPIGDDHLEARGAVVEPEPARLLYVELAPRLRFVGVRLKEGALEVLELFEVRADLLDARQLHLAELRGSGALDWRNGACPVGAGSFSRLVRRHLGLPLRQDRTNACEQCEQAGSANHSYRRYRAHFAPLFWPRHSLVIDCRNNKTRCWRTVHVARLSRRPVAASLWRDWLVLTVQAAVELCEMPLSRISRFPMAFAGLIMPSSSMRSMRSAARL